MAPSQICLSGFSEILVTTVLQDTDAAVGTCSMKSCSKNFRKIHMKARMPESLFDKIVAIYWESSSWVEEVS